MWSDLSQEEKYELMKGYVKKGFNNLDDIMNDFDVNEAQSYVRDTEHPSPLNEDAEKYADIFREFYGLNGIDSDE